MSDFAFVLMPFEPKQAMDSVFEMLQGTVVASGFRCERSDLPAPPPQGDIADHVWKRVLDASLIVADLTGFNPNVFFELGVCHLLRKPIIYISQEEGIPFYIRPKLVHHYRLSRLDQLRAVLQERIMEFVENLDSTLVADQVARFESRQLVDRLSGIAQFQQGGQYRYELPRGVGGTTFSRALGQLPPNWCYDTLSQIPFWSIRNIAPLEFLQSNVDMARSGVRIRRTLMLRGQDTSSLEVQTLLTELRRAQDDVSDFIAENPQSKGSLTIRILETPYSDHELQQRGMHFAVIYRRGSNENTGFVFEPQYDVFFQFDAIRFVSENVAEFHRRFGTYWTRSKPMTDYLVP